jgi:mannose-1-phosphate guanylyltransferase
MRAVLLAGGLGTREKPFTDYCPKAMIPIEGRPHVDHITRYICKFSFISEILIVCEFDSFGNQIINYFEGKEKIIGKKIRFVEDKKNGTGGALFQCRELLKDEPFFLVWYADNLCALHLNDMYKKFKLLEDKKQEKLPIAMVVTRSKRHEETGRVLVNDHCQDNVYVIESFVEKPIINLENPEAVGIYLFTQRILDELMYCAEMHSSQSFDLSSDILSHVKYDEQNKLYAYDIEYTKKEWVDIESPTFVNRNKVSMKTIVNQMINWRIFD